MMLVQSLNTRIPVVTKIAFGAAIAAVFIALSGMFAIPVGHAQTSSNDMPVINPPSTSIDVEFPNTGAPVDQTATGISSGTWLVLGVIVLVLAVMMVGWGMGSRSDRV